jgi:hypothetical protein
MAQELILKTSETRCYRKLPTSILLEFGPMLNRLQDMDLGLFTIFYLTGGTDTTKLIEVCNDRARDLGNVLQSDGES